MAPDKGPLIKPQLIHYLVFALLLVSIGAIGFYLSDRADESQMRAEAHRILAKTLDRLEEEKHQARTYATLLAKNSKIAQALANADRAAAIEAVAELGAQAQNDPILSSLRFQVHTSDLRTFVRSWDYKAHGQLLEGFRKGVVFTKEHQVPTVSVELGRLLNIKAIAPVFYRGRYVGSVEVIAGFSRMAEALKKEGIDMAVFMEPDRLKIAVDMAGFPRVAHWVLATPWLLPEWGDLEAKTLRQLQTNGFAQTRQRVLAAATLHGYEGEPIALLTVSQTLKPGSFRHALLPGSNASDLPRSDARAAGLSDYDVLDLAALIARRNQVPVHERALFNRALIDKAEGQSREQLLRLLLLEERARKKSVRIQ